MKFFAELCAKPSDQARGACRAGFRRRPRGVNAIGHSADQTYTDPQNSHSWFPSGDQHSPSVFQGSTTVPNLCSGGQMTLKQGGTFSAGVGSTDKTDKVNIRWHYCANGSVGGWSGTKSVVPS